MVTFAAHWFESRIDAIEESTNSQAAVRVACSWQQGLCGEQHNPYNLRCRRRLIGPSPV